MKENALNGEKSCVSIADMEPSPTVQDNTAKVLTTASFAESPAITAAAARQSPKPSGANTGSVNFPAEASRLSLLSETICMLLSKD